MIFHLIYNAETGQYGLLMSPEYLKDDVRAYGFIKKAEKLLDEYYAKDLSLTQKIITGVRNAGQKLNFRNMIRGKN